MVIPVGEAEQTLIKVQKMNGNVVTELIEMVRFVPLVAGDLA